MKPRLLALTLALCTLTGPASALGGSGPQPVARTLTLDLGGVPSRAELLLPPGAGRAPLVLLIQGTGPEDRDGSFATYGGVVQGSLGDLARTLAAQGFAVMRYDKRYAAQSLDPQTAQAAQEGYGKLTLRDLLADARTALDAARAQPGVDGAHPLIYGWSEGSVVAANLALQDGVDAAGLAVQGPVVQGFAQAFARQFERVGIPYLNRFADGGKIGLPGVLKAFAGGGAGLALTQVQFLLARDSTPQVPRLNTAMDTDGDGLIDLRAEALPFVQAYFARAVPTLPLYAPATSLPVLGDLVPRLKLPVLIVQGENDANIDPADAQALAQGLRAAGNSHVTLRLYPGLGHSLGPSADVTQDNFARMAGAPMNDIAAWMRGVVGR